MAKKISSTEWFFLVLDFLCQQADSLLHASLSEADGGWDLDNPQRPEEQRKEDYLTLLKVGRNMMTMLESNMSMAEARALDNGANYGEVGAARGISRQAVRQAENRRNARRAVTLVGGPEDNERAFVTGTSDRLTLPVGDDGGYNDWYDEPPQVFAVYKRKYGSPTVFEFTHFERSDGTVVAEPQPR
jgi:hypothetical protein